MVTFSKNAGSTTMKLSEPWYTLVKERIKTAEIRIYDEKRKQLSEGDEITFTKEDGSDPFVRRILKLEVFPSFRNALEYISYKNAIPTANSLEEAIAVYESIPGYLDNSIKYGVLLIVLS